MNIRELLKRKFRRGWSDLQFLVMLEMGQHGRIQFMDLVDNTGASASGVGNTLSRQPVVDYVVRVSSGGRSFYELTNAGKRAVVELLAPIAKESRVGEYPRKGGGEARGFLC